MNNIKNTISTLLLALLILGLGSCKNNPNPEITPDTRRTILVYMVASNSLGSYGYDDKDIVEMENAMKTYNYNDCRLLIYHVPNGTSSDINLIEISAKDNIVTTDTLKTYSKDISSVSTERFSQVFSDMKTLAPADDYGLVLWSHATGWSCNVSSSSSSTTYSLVDAETGNKILTRTFGDDNDDSISITSLAEAIPAGLFSFIYTDACYMGGIEIAYQFRNITNYFIGSPTTLYAAGMPYNQNILYFFETEANLVAACEATYNYYQALSGSYQTNTIVLVDCTKLESLATACRKIVSNPNDYTLSNIQKYITSSDYRNVFNYNYIAYDLKDYCLAISQDEYLDEFNIAFEDAVIYCAATKYIFSSLYIDPDKFFGLSTYILGTGNEAQEEYYTTLDWYKAIY
ncbi:MAG: clostripain-related cysteine peptidase [Bacteroidales bacterium]